MIFKNRNNISFGTVQARIVGSNKKTLGLVSTDPFAIGYVSIGCAQRVAQIGGRVKLHALDGIEPTAENVRNEKYPLRRPLYLLTRGEPQGTVKAFIEFLQSAQGQKIVESMEFIRLI